MLSDTFYDTTGRTVKTFANYYATGAPSVDLVTPTDITTVPSQTRTIYDGAGRSHRLHLPAVQCGALAYVDRVQR